MLGQPASSHTVCRPSRRTSDLSSVYSGPVFSRVLIHSGLRSIGTWLLRTSRRSSLRPAGSSGESWAGTGDTDWLMISTVPAGDDAAPVARATGAAAWSTGWCGSDLAVRGAGGRALVRAAAARGEGLRGVLDVLTGGRRAVTLDELGIADAHVRLVGRGVAGRVGGGDGLAAEVVGTGHGVLSVARDRAVARGRGGPVVRLLAPQEDEGGRTQREGGEHPRPATARLGLGAERPLDRRGGGQGGL